MPLALKKRGAPRARRLRQIDAMLASDGTSPEERLGDAQESDAEAQTRPADLAIWIAWPADADALDAAIAPIGAAEQHELVSLQPINPEAGLWRCGFAFDGGEAEQDERIVALLRRLGGAARWLRVERFCETAADPR